VSAHWYTEGTAVTAMEKPKTIHDFYGFPQALFDVQYPAPGDPQLASRVRELLAPTNVNMDQSWDWITALVRAETVYPEANIPSSSSASTALSRRNSLRSRQATRVAAR